jgi:hypothetical protein
VTIPEEYDFIEAPIYDALGIYYGLTKIPDQQRWKLGSGKSSLGYFTRLNDAQCIIQVLQTDPDVAAGLVEVEVIEQNCSILQMYQSVEIDINKFYPESCVNGSSSALPAMSPKKAVRFLSSHD